MGAEKIELVCGYCSFFFKARRNIEDTRCPVCGKEGPHPRYVKGQFPRAWVVSDRHVVNGPNQMPKRVE